MTVSAFAANSDGAGGKYKTLPELEASLTDLQGQIAALSGSVAFDASDKRFETRTALAAATIAGAGTAVNTIATDGDTAAGDGKASLWKYSASEPAHSQKIASNGSTVWWERVLYLASVVIADPASSARVILGNVVQIGSSAFYLPTANFTWTALDTHLAAGQLIPLSSPAGAQAVYADTGAGGAGDGTSWTDAYTTLQAALDACNAGDTLYLNSTRAVPFRSATLLATPDNLTVICDAGPDGETWISGARAATWTDEGSGIFSLTLAAEPKGCGYDLKQDDIEGTVTGVDVGTWSKEIERRGFQLDDCRAWYGVLRKASPATTTPAEGEWSYTGGKAYINPPGAPVLATVNTKAVYCSDTHGLTFSGDCANLRVSGRHTAFFFPSTANGEGYGVRLSSAEHATVEDTVAIMCGYHSVGAPSTSRDRNTYRNCLAVNQGASGGNPFVFYTSAASFTNAQHLGTGLLFIGCPHLDTLGAPILSGSTFSPKLGLSHTDGVQTLAGIRWEDCTQIDFVEQLAAKHSVSITSGVGAFTGSNTGATRDFEDRTTFPVTAYRCEVYGRCAAPDLGLLSVECIWSRQGFGADTEDLLNFFTAGASGSEANTLRVEGGKVHMGTCKRWAYSVEDNDKIYLGVGTDGALLEVRGTLAAEGAMIQGKNATLTAVNLFIDGIAMNLDADTDADLYQLGATAWSADPYGWVKSSGNNRFGANIQNSIGHSNPGATEKTWTEWKANVTGASSDLTGLADPFTPAYA